MNSRGPTGWPGSQPHSLSCPRPCPASLPQSPPVAKPGPHLGVISCLTSSRHLGLSGLISSSLELTLALTQLIPASPWLPQGLTTNSQPHPSGGSRLPAWLWPWFLINLSFPLTNSCRPGLFLSAETNGLWISF